MIRKSACPFGQVKTKTYLPESPFFKNSLAGASGLVLMSVPVILPKHVKVMTLEDAFKMFKEENPDTKIGCSSFKKLKPKNVRKVSETSRCTCLCTKCCNVALKVQALKKFIATSSPENKDLADKMTKAYLCDAVVCAYSSHLDKKCWIESATSAPSWKAVLKLWGITIRQ